jgi:glycosyltransferase involved in cell wall biosynthesis
MRLAQMIDTLDWGGAQKMQLFLVQKLIPLGIDVTVISLRPSNSPLPSLLREAGARVFVFPFMRLFSPASFMRMVAFARQQHFDLLHAYLTYSNILGPLVGKLSRTPVIGSFRNAGFDPKRMSSKRLYLETFCLKHFAQGIIANGYAVADYGRTRLGADIQIDILPNAIDADGIPALMEPERQALRKEIGGDANRTIILSVGRLTPQKGFPDLLRGFEQVSNTHPDSALVIAGNGDSRASLEAQIRKSGLKDRVFLLGERDDVPRLLAVADIYVNSSLIEGTPVSILEAMSAKLPIVATSVGDTPYILNETSAKLVAPHSPNELAVALTSLITSAESRHILGNAARERVVQKYGPEPWTKSLLQLYSKYSPSVATFAAKLPRS